VKGIVTICDFFFKFSFIVYMVKKKKKVTAAWEQLVLDSDIDLSRRGMGMEPR
jgi:hypothetical protein